MFDSYIVNIPPCRVRGKVSFERHGACGREPRAEDYVLEYELVVL